MNSETVFILPKEATDLGTVQGEIRVADQNNHLALARRNGRGFEQKGAKGGNGCIVPEAIVDKGRWMRKGFAT
jgi:hypothetical protein